MAKSIPWLMTSKQLAKFIDTFESLWPGYWWSISQKRDTTTISLGPSQYCLLDTDRAYAKTREGDSGQIITVPVVDEIDVEAIKIKLNDAFDVFIKARNTFYKTLRSFPPYQGRSRYQSKPAMQKLQKGYNLFIEALEQIEQTDSLFKVEELYLGSCQLSVDCSIRGTIKGESFDISYDLQGESTLAEALSEAMKDILITADKVLLVESD